MLRSLVPFAGACLLLVPSVAAAAPKTYAFGGSLTTAHAFNGASLPFALGQTFSGSFTIDTADITDVWTIVDQPNWRLDSYRGAIKNFTVTIDTPQDYTLPMPVQMGTLRVSAGSAAPWDGVELRMHNYDFVNVPVYPIPASAMVGNLVPHAAFFDLASVFGSHPMQNTSPDVDLVALFNQLKDEPFATKFDIRFTDPASPLWKQGVESLDAIVSGRVTSFALAVNAVPEPESWAMMLIGFAFAGAAVRRRSAPRLTRSLSLS